MKANRCTNCINCESHYESKGLFFDRWDRFYIICKKLGGDEITPILQDFISTCGCASWELDK